MTTIARSLAFAVEVVKQNPHLNPGPLCRTRGAHCAVASTPGEQTGAAARHDAHRILGGRSVIPRGVSSVMGKLLLGQTPPASATPARQWPAITLESLLYLVILALALLSRFWDLGSRALHHDESLHAYFSWLHVHGEARRRDALA